MKARRTSRVSFSALVFEKVVRLCRKYPKELMSTGVLEFGSRIGGWLEARVRRKSEPPRGYKSTARSGHVCTFIVSRARAGGGGQKFVIVRVRLGGGCGCHWCLATFRSAGGR